MHYYCLFCVNQKIPILLHALTEMGIGSPLIPKIVQRKWVCGKEQQEIHEYLPGYIFLYAEKPLQDYEPIWRMDGVIRLLGDAELQFELQGSDRAFARLLYQCEGTIGILTAHKEGDLVKLDRSMFGDFEGKIVRFDKSRKRCEIEFDFDGKKQRVWCGVELISPEGEEP